ncbi:MAG TPA: hypothetical protein VN285_00945 [Candidatus Deferrimicrobium sp.]|nr:hypothetical protein [Candidatus Deferrimicrobium sp.]
MSFFKGSAELPDPEKKALPEEEEALLAKVAGKVVERRMAVPAIVFLESVKPLNYIGSQAMVFFEPIVQALFNLKDYDTFRQALERRESIEILLLKIEELDAISSRREKRIRKFMKAEKKKWKWYQRWLGIATPKVKIPQDVIDGTPPVN